MDELRISFIQTSLHWEDCDENILHFSNLLSEIEPGCTDLIVLPEMFTTGFTMNTANMAEPPLGITVSWMKEYAYKLNSTIAGSIITQEENNFYNRLYVVSPEGNVHFYDKHHLFRIAGEQKYYTAGNNNLIVDILGWKINFLICYDLRFPVWSRNRCIEGNFDYDLMVYVANWPEQRAFAWKSLLPARAIENQAYVLGVNRVGWDGNKNVYSGDSTLYDFKGETIARALPHESKIIQTSIFKTPLNDFRKTFGFSLDWDSFEILDKNENDDDDMTPQGR